MSQDNLPYLVPNLQVGFYYRLKTIEELYFNVALKETVSKLDISNMDMELAQYVPKYVLTKLASFGLRGETVFPVPLLLSQNPYLLGYYRLLYGFSQKEFYGKSGLGRFKLMEDKGRISLKSQGEIVKLCKVLIKSGTFLANEIDNFSINLLHDLQLLTVGPQLRGSMNNEYGQIATQKTFNFLKELLKDYIVHFTPSNIEIQNEAGRNVVIKFSSDPDIAIIEKISTGWRYLVSIEIKGGKDISNIHNRIGEAEKSHQKSKTIGYFEFITILSIDFDYEILKKESPTTNHFFNLDKISHIDNIEFTKFKAIISSILSINI